MKTTRSPSSNENSARVELLLDPGRVDLAGSSIELLRLGRGRGEARLMLREFRRTYVVQLLAKHLGRWQSIGEVQVRPRGAVRIGIGWASGTLMAAHDAITQIPARERQLEAMTERIAALEVRATELEVQAKELFRRTDPR